jgi:hypothetical protein
MAGAPVSQPAIFMITVDDRFRGVASQIRNGRPAQHGTPGQKPTELPMTARFASRGGGVHIADYALVDKRGLDRQLRHRMRGLELDSTLVTERFQRKRGPGY